MASLSSSKTRGKASSPSALLWMGTLAVLSGALAGCTKAPPAEFDLNMVTMAQYEFEAPEQQRIASTLAAMFGTPDEPVAFTETGLDLNKLKRAAGPVGSDATGAQVGLYRRHCVHCHGINGDGQGPTAQFLNPYPRDYRQGIYKFKSTPIGSAPTRADLLRTLKEGIPGTAMPSFLLLPESELEALVEYVIYLSMRGQMEATLASLVYDMSDPTDAEEFKEDVATREVLVEEALTEIAEKWNTADENIIRPAEETIPRDDRTPEQIAASAAAGRDLFFGARAACSTCHGRTALGDGQTNDFDAWNKTLVEFAKGVTSPEPPAADASDEERQEYEKKNVWAHRKQDVLAASLPIRNLIPRNLRSGVYRGGRRPLDIYRRIAAGIEGALMPAGAKKSPEATVGLSEEEIWQLVDYVKSLPFEPASARPESWNAWQQQEDTTAAR